MTTGTGAVVAGASRHHRAACRQEDPADRPGVSRAHRVEGDDPADLLVVARVYFELVAQANARVLHIASAD